MKDELIYTLRGNGPFCDGGERFKWQRLGADLKKGYFEFITASGKRINAYNSEIYINYVLDKEPDPNTQESIPISKDRYPRIQADEKAILN